MNRTQKTGADLLVDLIHKQGVEYIFGYPGGQAIPIFDALVDSPIKFILTRHEQGATHMADGFARATGKPGVVLVTSGPGATNTITGIMTAHMDSIPMVIISGQQMTGSLGLDAFQEVDIFGVTLPVVKHSYLIKRSEDIPRVVKEAFYLANTGRPGPVLIDFPKDVASKPAPSSYSEDFQLPGYRIPSDGSRDKIEAAAEFLRKAKRPVLLVGHGVVISGAEKAVLYLAEKLQIPVVNTFLGKGGFPETHSLSLGMCGMHGTAYANMALVDCDLVMSIGSRWDDRLTGKVDEFCSRAVKIHVDIDSAEIGKIIKPDCFIVGDAKIVLEEINSVVQKGDTAAWVKQITQWKRRYPLTYKKGGKLKAQAVIDEVYRLTGGNAVAVTDVGQHQMWAAQYYKVDHRFHWISSGGSGTMGFGLPASLGASFACPGKTVVLFVGDGGFQMTQSELATAAVNKLPVKIILFNNRYLGMVRQWQNMFYDNRLSGVELHGNPDFVKLAESYGVKGFRIKRGADVKRILAAALAYNEGPCLVDVEVEKEDNVYPMVPAGRPLSDMLLEPPKRTS
jgi:acetolactate synthase-1/2/3 large subunit